MSFIEYNQLEDVYNRKYLEIEQIRREYPHIVQVFKNSRFAPEIVRGLSLALDDLEGRPLIVRSSSLLEDRIGAAFSGKYKSLFLANVGTKNERLSALMDAIAEVYASLFGPDPIEYRAERGPPRPPRGDGHHDPGGGRHPGRPLLHARRSPAWPSATTSSAGRRASAARTAWCASCPASAPARWTAWATTTRCSWRPASRACASTSRRDEVFRYAPRQIDVINLETRRFETLDIDDLLRECGRRVPGAVADRLGLRPGRHPAPARLRLGAGRRPRGGHLRGPDREHRPSWRGCAALLKLLREKMGVPVDVEFASRRPRLLPAAVPAPELLARRPSRRRSRATFRATASSSPPTGTCRTAASPRSPTSSTSIRNGTTALESLADLKDVGRAVGRLNKLLPKRQFILMGPGRWGSRGDIKLGVSVTYSDINNTAVLMEIAARRGNYVPDLSFGTHFFQDLVEAGIRYLPLFPDDRDRDLQRAVPPALAEHPGGPAPRVRPPRRTSCASSTSSKASDGLVLHVLMNADLDEAVGYLGTPTHAKAPSSLERKSEPASLTEDHWRWRLRMAEHLAAQLDAERFGVKGLYVFGSTKNATAGRRQRHRPDRPRRRRRPSSGGRSRPGSRVGASASAR